MPARRSHRRATRSASRSRVPSRSRTRTKSFSVPWPLVNPRGVGWTGASGMRPAYGSSAASAGDGGRHGGERLGEQLVGGRSGVEPDHPAVAAEPLVLPPRESPCRADGLVPRLVEGEGPVEVVEHLRVPQGAGRRAPLAAARAAPGRPPRRRARRRASRRPAARSARRAASRGARSPTCTVGRTYAPSGRVAVNGRPVSSTTSSARTTRRTFAGSIAAAAAGSRSASSACSARGPTCAALASQRARTSGSVPGNSSGSSSARTYSPEPPTTTGTRPRARTSSTAARASRW